MIGRKHIFPKLSKNRALTLTIFILLLFFILHLPAAAVTTASQADNLAHPAARTAQQERLPQKNVLILFPYQIDLPQTELATRAIREQFDQAADLDISLYFEYMDLNRITDKSYEAQLAELYAVKYSQIPIDLVLLTSGVTLDFWLTYRDYILLDVPGIFYDISTKDLAGRPYPPDITGVGTIDNYAVSIRWIMQTRLDIDEIILVYGTGVADQGFLAPISALKRELEGEIMLTDWSHLPLEEIKQRAAELPPDTAIFYHLMFEDAAGVKHRPIDTVRELARVSAVPVLTAYDQFIGTGTIGGYMYSIEQHAGIASHVGLRILRGEAVGDIPMFADLENEYIFDHSALQRYDIPLSALPAGSIIKNRQYTVWELYRGQLMAIVAGFLVLILVIIGLAALNRRLQISRQILDRLNINLEKQVQERTSTLIQTNRRLETEIEERIQAEVVREQLISELQEALTRVQQLEGILPICSFCKKIRDKDDSWQAIESYISDRSQAQFSHSFCPECAREHYPRIFDKS